MRRRSAPTPRRVQVAQWNACYVRGLAALGRGDYEEAYRQAAGLSETALTYDAPLRRTRAPTVSRAHLTAALDTVERPDSQSFPSTEIWRFIEMSANTTGTVTNGMLLAAAEAVAGQADVSAPGASLQPAVQNLRASPTTTAVAVARAAADDGVATRKPDDLVQAAQEAMSQPVYPDSMS